MKLADGREFIEEKESSPKEEGRLPATTKAGGKWFGYEEFEGEKREKCGKREKRKIINEKVVSRVFF